MKIYQLNPDSEFPENSSWTAEDERIMQGAIWKTYRNLAEGVCYKENQLKEQKWACFEDLRQEMRKHLIEKKPLYDDKRGKKTTFYYTVIERKLIDMLRQKNSLKMGGEKVDIPLKASTSEDYDDKLEARLPEGREGFVGPKPWAVDLVNSWDVISIWIDLEITRSHLTKQENLCLKMMYEGYNFAEIGRRLKSEGFSNDSNESRCGKKIWEQTRKKIRKFLF